jgi:NADPH:quinone reductase-like Zn-dependent oxidoreductase
MKTVRLKAPGGIKNLLSTEENYPQPGPGELLVRIRASSLNAHDDMVIQGLIPCADGLIPLNDGAGEVIAVGGNVDEFKVGDVVVSTFWPYWLGGDMTQSTKRDIPGDSIDGYAREYVCRPAHAFTKVPAGYTPAEAATLPTAGVTAWRGLVECGRVKPGDSVLILGTGGVSIFALQFAKAAGARVIATSSSDEKMERLKRLGADEVINYKAVPDWGRKVKELTDGRGVDQVIETGGPDTLMQSIEACRLGGHITLIGVLTGFAGELGFGAMLFGQIRMSAIMVGSRSSQEDMIRAIEVGRLKPVIDKSFPLDDIAGAFEYYGSKKHFGKICIEL